MTDRRTDKLKIAMLLKTHKLSNNKNKHKIANFLSFYNKTIFQINKITTQNIDKVTDYVLKPNDIRTTII